MSILIKNGIVVTQNPKREVVKADVYIESNKISAIGKSLRYEVDNVINANGKIVMPGLINTHTHIAMSDLRSRVDDVNLDEFLKKTAEVDATKTKEDVYKNAKEGIMELIMKGTTSFLDLYYDEDMIAKAAKEVGCRAFLAWAVLDDEFTTQKGSPIKNAENFIAKFKSFSPLIKPVVGLQGIYVCSIETMSKAKKLADSYKTIITMHVSETKSEVENAIKKYGRTPIETMDEIGLLDDKMVAVHTVYLSSNDIKILKRNRVNTSYNPVSNMKLGNGPAAPIISFLKNKINVTLGTDSVASNNNLDMFESMKVGALLQKTISGDPTAISSGEALDFATINAAKALGMEESLGSIEIGKLADIIIVSAPLKGSKLNESNAINDIVYYLQGLDVDCTIINGKIVYEKNKQ
ncbi:MAG: amidohydrolase family protein [Candidatus Micrarchaeia archaeon]